MKKIKTADMTDGASETQAGENNVASAMEKAETRRVEQEVHEEDVSKADKDAIDEIIMSQAFGKGGKIRITRKGPMDQTFQYVATVPADSWDTEDSVEWCKKMFGGGDYKCQTFRANGSMYRPFTFSIDYRFKGSLDNDALKALAEGKGKDGDVTTKVLDALSKREDGGLKATDILTIMEKSGNSQAQMMTLIMTLQMKSQESQTQMMATMITAMATMMKPAASQGPSNNMENLMIELIRQKQEHTPMKETLEMMASIREIFGNNDKEPKEEDMFDKIARIAGPLMGLASGARPQPAPLPQVTAPPPGQPPTPPPTSSLGGAYAQMSGMQKMFFDMVLAAAERGADPALYVDLIIDQTPPQHFEEFQKTLTASDWCAKLFGNEQAVAHIRPWLDELRQMILTATTEPNGTQDNTGGEAASSVPTSAGPGTA